MSCLSGSTTTAVEHYFAGAIEADVSAAISPPPVPEISSQSEPQAATQLGSTTTTVEHLAASTIDDASAANLLPTTALPQVSTPLTVAVSSLLSDVEQGMINSSRNDSEGPFSIEVLSSPQSIPKSATSLPVYDDVLPSLISAVEAAMFLKSFNFSPQYIPAKNSPVYRADVVFMRFPAHEVFSASYDFVSPEATMDAEAEAPSSSVVVPDHPILDMEVSVPISTKLNGPKSEVKTNDYDINLCYPSLSQPNPLFDFELYNQANAFRKKTFKSYSSSWLSKLREWLEM